MVNKYLYAVKSGFKQQMSEKGQLVGRLVGYLLIVYLFSQVFQSANATSSQFWYIAMSQIVTLSTSMVAFQIAQDIHSGQIAHFLIRPINYVGYKFCEGMGTCLIRYSLLITFYLGIKFYVTGSLPEHFLVGIIFGFMGIILYSLTSILIGILSYWIVEIKNIFYLNLTATFCFGGLIIPLEFYPSYIKFLCFATPYPWILWWPSEIMSDLAAPLTLGFLGFAFWVVVFITIIMKTYKKCIKSFTMEGG